MPTPKTTATDPPTGRGRRALALAAWRAGLAAVGGEAATRRALDGRSDIRLTDPSTLVVAAGKAAASMVRAALPASRAMVLVPSGTEVAGLPPDVAVLRGGHPYPTLEGIDSTRRILAAVDELGAGETLLVLLSGGASALLEAPADGVDAHDLIATYRALVGSGAPIAEINRIRICLSAVKGGGLARRARHARVVTLAISDVEGDRPETIGSGPTVPQAADAAWAGHRLQELGLEVPPAVADYLRARAADCSRKDAPVRDLDFQIVACGRDAASASAAYLAGQGYSVTCCDLRGDTALAAREMTSRIERMQRSPQACALIAVGETVVRLGAGKAGRGGRNLDLASRLALALASPSAASGAGFACACAGTDGVDGSSRAAGALIDEDSARRASGAGLPLQDAIAAFDTEPALAAAGDLIVSGPTGTNVGDLLVAIAGRGASERYSC